MSTIYSLDGYHNYGEIINLWNEEVGFIYPLTNKNFQANVINEPTMSWEDSYVAFVEGKLVGFIIVKTGKSLDKIPEYQDFAWISLMFVSKKYRKQGIGGELLKRAEGGLSKKGIKEIIVGKDINNFFPGIPIDFNRLTTDWFLKRGFQVSYQTHDLIAKSSDLSRFDIRNKHLEFRLAKQEEKTQVIEFVRSNFSNRWAYEVEQVFTNPKKGNQILLCLDNDEILAFCKINNSKEGNVTYNTVWANRFTRLGGIGPLGVSVSRRKIGLGYDIVAESINYLLDEGVSDIIIDWTGLISFYQQFNFEVWKSYFYASKKMVKIIKSFD